MAWFLLFVVVGGAIFAVLAWDYRKKAAAREAESQKRFAALMRVQTAAARAPEPSAAAAVPVPGAPAPAKPSTAATPAPVRDRFLGQRETLLYYLLRTGVPDHEVFPNVPLASVVAVPGAGTEREQQLRRLAQYHLDFVVCDKSMRIVAAIEVEPAAGAGAAGERRFVADTLNAAGIRIVRVNPAAPPRRDQVRALVCGPGPSGGPPAPG